MKLKRTIYRVIMVLRFLVKNDKDNIMKPEILNKYKVFYIKDGYSDSKIVESKNEISAGKLVNQTIKNSYIVKIERIKNGLFW